MAFVLDRSGSVESTFELILEVTRKVIDGLNFAGGKTRVSVTTYDSTARVQFLLNKYNQKLSVLNAISYDLSRGKTNTQGALRLVREDVFTSGNGDRVGVDNVLVLLSDGNSNVQTSQTLPQATAVKNANIRIISVGVGASVNAQELNSIASSPSNSNTFFTKTTADVDATADKILNLIC